MAEQSRTPSGHTRRDPGPYLAKVVNHLDSKFMGTLEVELLKVSSSGNTTQGTGEIITVKYLSPFYGVTPYAGLTKNEGYKYTQKSYGMWAVPPDIGTQVLVIFAEGNLSRGYWIGCVQDEYMNFMLPGMASSFYNDTDTTKPHPVGEYNKKNETGAGRNPTKFIKPASLDAITSLSTQGLFDDSIRGTTTSSARREVPSMVFGWSTPGPEDRREGAPRATYGDPRAGGTQRYYNRLGGSTFVMDDGDPSILRTGYASATKAEYVSVEEDEDNKGFPDIPHNELVRLRTRTGHQILMHNSEDLIYIGNARGTAWIELTSLGKIDIYSSDSISIRSEMDLNFSADRDINFAAGQNVNMNVGNTLSATVVADTNIITGADTKITTGGQGDIFIGAEAKIFAGGGLDIKVTGDGKLTTSAALDVVSGTTSKLKAGSTLDIKSGTNTRFSQGGTLDVNATGALKLTGATLDLNPSSPAASALDASEASLAESSPLAPFPTRVPEHEPWLGHEHLDPTIFTPENTRAGVPSESLRESSPPIFGLADEQATTTQFRDSADVRYDTIDGKRVDTPQEVVPGQTGPVGEQPAKPVAVNDQQRYFLDRLIKKLGLDPATCLNYADPNKNAPGVTPGNAEALGMAMAQVQRECGFKPKSENLNYSAKRLRQVFPSRVRSDSFAQRLANAGPAAIGNTLYGGRYGNKKDEGYKYRGRGLIQLTFKENYERYGKLAGKPEVIENPDLANDPEIATELAIAYLNSKSITWSGTNFNSFGNESAKAVGYAAQNVETPKRVSLGKGFAAQIANGKLTPLASLTTEPAGTNTKAEAIPPVDTFKQEVKGTRQ